MRDRDAIESMLVSSSWTITRHARYTEFKLGSKYDAGPKVEVWWDRDGAASSAQYYDGDGEVMASTKEGVMGWLAHQLR